MVVVVVCVAAFCVPREKQSQMYWRKGRMRRRGSRRRRRRRQNSCLEANKMRTFSEQDR